MSDAETVSHLQLFTFILKTYDKQFAAVSYYTAARVKTMRYLQHEVTIRKVTLGTALVNIGAWQHHWSQPSVADFTRESTPNGVPASTASPDMPGDLKRALEEAQELARRQQSERERNTCA